LFFAANDGVHGTELWTSDGTAAGTVLVKDINPGSSSSYPYSLTAVNGKLFFTANDGVHGQELWRSDGTAAGTSLGKDINPGTTLVEDINLAGIGSNPDQLVGSNGTPFFAADDGVHGRELWKSNGTAAGTVLVKDIFPGRYGSYPGSLVMIGSTLFFRANDGV